MLKTIIKEIFITIALLVIMLLLLGILLYENVAFDKVIPEIKEYKTPDEIKNEINTNSNLDFQNEIITYELTESDLKLYKKYDIYDPGKSNPFINTLYNTTYLQESTNNVTNTTSNSSIVKALNKTQNIK